MPSNLILFISDRPLGGATLEVRWQHWFAWCAVLFGLFRSFY